MPIHNEGEVEAAKPAHRKVQQQDAFWRGLKSHQVTHGPEVVKNAIAVLDACNLRPRGHVE